MNLEGICQFEFSCHLLSCIDIRWQGKVQITLHHLPCTILLEQITIFTNTAYYKPFDSPATSNIEKSFFC